MLDIYLAVNPKMARHVKTVVMAYLHDTHACLVFVDKLCCGCAHDPVGQASRTCRKISDCSVTNHVMMMIRVWTHFDEEMKELSLD